MRRLQILGMIGVLLFPGPSRAAMEGVVWNGTTGRTQGGVEVTLLRLEQGMIPVGKAQTNGEGQFRFEQDPTGAELMLRAEFEGVPYNERIPSGARTGDVRITIYRSAKFAGAPEQHILLLEPSGGEMTINESFLYRNQSRPPVTYVDAGQGTLRFYLSEGAKGNVQVSVTGPAGVPVRAKAEKTEVPGAYQVNFPIKPGDSRIDLTYRVPYQPPLEFLGQNLYPGVLTRIAAPIGVTLSGEGLQPLGEEPRTKASVFNAGTSQSFRVTITGEGRLARAGEEGAEEGGDSISAIPAAVNKQLWLILAFALAILGLGFYALYTASGGPAAAERREKRKS